MYCNFFIAEVFDIELLELSRQFIEDPERREPILPEQVSPERAGYGLVGLVDLFEQLLRDLVILEWLLIGM